MPRRALGIKGGNQMLNKRKVVCILGGMP